MAIKFFADLPKSEQEDFAAACAKRRLAVDDFVVGMEEQFPLGGVGHITRLAQVRRSKAREGKKYPAGSGTAWIIAFEQDLLAGVFD